MACLAAKPVVDGLEEEHEGRASVLRADIQSRAGRELAGRYDVATVPSFIVLSGDEVVARFVGSAGVPVGELRRALRRAGG